MRLDVEGEYDEGMMRLDVEGECDEWAMGARRRRVFGLGRGQQCTGTTTAHRVRA